MRGVQVLLCVIATLLTVSMPASARQPSRVPAMQPGQSSPQDRTDRSSRDDKGSDENGKDENGKSDNGKSQNGAARQTQQQESQDDDEVDTSDIFGFTEGSDTSDKDTRVLFHEVIGHFGRRDGFARLRGSLGFAYSPSDHLQVAILAASDYEQARGDPLDNGLRGSLDFGLVASAKYRILQREKESWFGLAVQFAPYWQRGAEITGGEHDKYGAEIRLMADYEIIRKNLIGAINLVYRPEGQNWPDGTSTQTSHFEATGAVSAQVATDLYVGAELRYLAHYDGAFFNRFSGWGLFAGPTIYASLGENAYIGAAWSIQIAGGAAEEPSLNLDLGNFERHQVRIKSGITF
jgi:hypothetical protein